MFDGVVFAAHSEGDRDKFMLSIGMVMTGASAELAPKFSFLHLFVSRLLTFVPCALVVITQKSLLEYALCCWNINEFSRPYWCVWPVQG